MTSQKQWELERAKLARAALAGNCAEHPTAMRFGFKNPSQMREAIAELEAEEAKAAKSNPGSKFDTNTLMARSRRIQIEQKPIKDGLAPMYVLVNTTYENSYCRIHEDQLPDLVECLRQMPSGNQLIGIEADSRTIQELSHENDCLLKELDEATALITQLKVMLFDTMNVPPLNV